MMNRIRQSLAIAMAFVIVATSINAGSFVVDAFRATPTASLFRLNKLHNHAFTTTLPTSSTTCKLTTSSSQLSATPSNTGNNDDEIDSLILRTSNVLRASSWFSWWSQVILTVISSITFIFARNVMTMPTTSSTSGIIGGINQGAMISKFFLPGLGIAASSLSIIWTWGQRRLARRFVRSRRGSGGGSSNTSTSKSSFPSRIEAANLLRSTIKFGVSINLFGLLTSVLGAQYIIGTLVAKSMQSFVGLGGSVITSQTLQPLDVLVVQANTNVLSSHFVSLVCLLWLTRMVDLLDPPSLEDDI